MNVTHIKPGAVGWNITNRPFGTVPVHIVEPLEIRVAGTQFDDQHRIVEVGPILHMEGIQTLVIRNEDLISQP